MSSKYSTETAKRSAERATRSPLYLIALAVPLSLGCGTDSLGEPSGDGGTSMGGASASAGAGAGGRTAQGGAGTGGASVGGTSSMAGAAAGGVPAGGASSTGGAGTGGSTAAGGTAAGGATSSGGTAAGGSTATGGMAAGGATSSGGTATGGAMTGGSSHGGAGGSSAAGASGGGAGGSSGSGSPGCGAANPLSTGTFTESIGGASRRWMLDVPDDYDANQPYRLIFVWHPLGGNGGQVVGGGFNGLKALSDGTAIFATADGLNGSNAEASGTGWWNANGGDMELVELMLETINAGLCVDQERIFSTGFSFGGMMSYTLPFEFDVFRAVAPSSGKDGVIPHETTFDRPIPILALHGNNDTFVLTSLGKAFFEEYRAERNQCGTQTQAVNPSPCVQYQGCEEPAIWCEFPGGHEMWSQAPQAIWQFFSQF